MKFLKSLLMGTGGVVLAGLVLALLAPKAVHAVVATAVQVVNTSANPAITEDASRQASQIVTIQCGLLPHAFGSCIQILPNGLVVNLTGPHGGYVVPANQYFVAKSIDLVGTVNTAGGGFIEILLSDAALNIIGIETFSPPLNGTDRQISFSSGIAVAPGMEVILLGSVAEGEVTLHGYLTSN